MKVSSLSEPDPTLILALEEESVYNINIYVLYIHKSILEDILITIGIGYSGDGVRGFLMIVYPLYDLNFFISMHYFYNSKYH